MPLNSSSGVRALSPARMPTRSFCPATSVRLIRI
jgi:hypothetical protein